MFNSDFFDKLKSDSNIEEFYKIIMDSIPDVLVVTNTEGKIEFVTPQAFSLFKFNSPEDVIGKSALEFIANEDKSRAAENIANIFKGIYASDKTYKLVKKDGTEFYGEIVNSVLHDGNDNPKGLVTLIRNISDRKAAELELREKDMQLRIAVSEASVILFIIDADGIFRLSEGKGLEKLGLKPGEVVGQSAFDVYKDYPVICRQVRDALDGKTVHENLHIRNTVFDIIYNPLIDRKFNIKSLIGIAVDITDRYNAELALKESEERFKTMFTAMSEGAAIHELIYNKEGKPVDYRIIETNPAYENQTGIKYNDAINKLATELYETAEPPYINVFSEVVLTGKSYRFETYFPPMDRYFRISAVSLGKNRFASVFEDITAYKKYLKEIKDKNEELERFTYTVSHDLKSPLVTIKGFIEMILQDIKEAKYETLQDDMKRISSAAEKMGNLLNDLLELSRI
jgi:PAS domain S-box-containing protein